MKKLHVGDSIKFKDGRVGVVEDYDDDFFYVKDNNTNTIKIKKDSKTLENESYKIDLEKVKKAMEAGITREEWLSHQYKEFPNVKKGWFEKVWDYVLKNKAN